MFLSIAGRNMSGPLLADMQYERQQHEPDCLSKWKRGWVNVQHLRPFVRSYSLLFDAGVLNQSQEV